MKIRYSKKSLKFLAKQERATVERIKAAIKKLTYTPPEGDIKEMQGCRDKFRLRVGSYRIIYWYTEGVKKETDTQKEIKLKSSISTKSETE